MFQMLAVAGKWLGGRMLRGAQYTSTGSPVTRPWCMVSHFARFLGCWLRTASFVVSLTLQEVCNYVDCDCIEPKTIQSQSKTQVNQSMLSDHSCGLFEEVLSLDSLSFGTLLRKGPCELWQAADHWLSLVLDHLSSFLLTTSLTALMYF